MSADQESGQRNAARRRFLRFLLQSPLLATPALLAPAGLVPGRALARPELAIPGTLDEVLDVFQMQRAAQKALDPESWHFIVNGADDLRTLEANRAAFDDHRPSLARSPRIFAKTNPPRRKC